MKYVIIGFNACGKQQVAEDLKSMGVKVAKVFRSIEKIPENIYSISETVYNREDIDAIFESKSYIFFTENTQSSTAFYEGLSFYEYDNSDVIIITPNQFNMVPKFDEDVVFIWMDCNNDNRRSRFLSEKRKYNYQAQDALEQQNVQDFVNRIFCNPYLYFCNEEPDRVSAIIYSLVKYPELFDIYKKRFN